jgi:hypothetical protein
VWYITQGIIMWHENFFKEINEIPDIIRLAGKGKHLRDDLNPEKVRGNNTSIFVYLSNR